MNRRTLIIAGAIGIIVIAFFLILSMNKKPLANIESKPSSSAQELYETAKSLEEKNETLQARDTFQKIVSDYPEFKDVATSQKRLEGLNLRIIFSTVETSKTLLHDVQPGDSLAKIAKKYNTTIELLKRSNGLSSDIIRVGQKIRVWKGVFSVLVDKSQNTLTLKCDDEIVKTYAVATGKNNITPVGTFKITDKLVNPVWFKSGAILPPDSPQNALGTRWMGFNIPGYGIHGTIEPDSIGQQVTAGCVRMRNEDVEELYSLLPVGTQVTIID